jgi:hypothetical protein
MARPWIGFHWLVGEFTTLRVRFSSSKNGFSKLVNRLHEPSNAFTGSAKAVRPARNAFKVLVNPVQRLVTAFMAS